MTDYDIIREACIKANPELPKRHISEDEDYDIIRLADVLLALEIASNTTIIADTKGRLREVKVAENYGFSGAPSWNLRNDDLSQQSPETLKFLADLLRV